MATKHKPFGLSLLFLALGLASCSQQEDAVTESGVGAASPGATTVAELTAQLRSDNEGLCLTEAPATRFYDTSLSRRDKVKIALADVKGGLCGSGGGPVGVITGAVGSSLKKYAQIWLWNQVKAWAMDMWDTHVVNKKNGAYVFADSVGYYHNLAEFEINKANPSYGNLPTVSLMLQADSIVRGQSEGYRASQPPSLSEMRAIAAEVDRAQEVDSKELSVDDYCARLKALNPADGEYIDFNAEYLYHILYSNDDVDAYTEKLLYTIEHGNLDVKDAALLSKTVRIGYASVKFSNKMKKQ